MASATVDVFWSKETTSVFSSTTVSAVGGFSPMASATVDVFWSKETTSVFRFKLSLLKMRLSSASSVVSRILETKESGLSSSVSTSVGLGNNDDLYSPASILAKTKLFISFSFTSLFKKNSGFSLKELGFSIISPPSIESVNTSPLKKGNNSSSFPFMSSSVVIIPGTKSFFAPLRLKTSENISCNGLLPSSISYILILIKLASNVNKTILFFSLCSKEPINTLPYPLPTTEDSSSLKSIS